MAVVVTVGSKFDNKGLKQAESGFKKFSHGMKEILGAAGIATGLHEVVNVIKETAQLAAENSKSFAVMGRTMHNATGATAEQTKAVDEQLKSLGMLTGHITSDLRPAFDTLVRSTKDSNKALDLLKIAQDASAGSGKDLGIVSLAMARYMAGNTTSLNKLFPATKGAKDQIDALRTSFAGMAQTAANADPLNRISVIFKTIQEELGTALLPALQSFANWLSSPETQTGIKAFVDEFTYLADYAKNATDGVNYLTSALTGLIDITPQQQETLWSAFFKSLGIQAKNLAIGPLARVYDILALMGAAKNQASSLAIKNTPSASRLTGQTKPDSGGLYTALKQIQDTSTKTATATKLASDKVKAAADAQKTAVASFKTSMSDLASALRPMAIATHDIGQFEQQAIDSTTAITNKIKDALANKTITDYAASVLNTYVTTEGKALAAIGAQRDALAAKRGLAETLIADVKSAVMGFGDITGLLKTTTETVVETQNVIINGIATTISKSVEKVSTNDIVAEYQKIIDKTKAFAKNLKVLKDAGLNQNLFKQIVDAGVDAGGATAEAIIAGGGSTISELNSLFTDLQDTGSTIAEQTAVVMYGAGVDLTNGLIEGMKSQEAALLAQAQQMADEVAATIANMMANLDKLKATQMTVSASSLDTFDYAQILAGAGNPITSEDIRFASIGQRVGATVNLTVNAGLGTNGASVAKDIVTTIKAYERTNGAVWSPA